MRHLILGLACLVSTALWAARPLFQAELDVTNAVEYAAGQSYRVDGRVTDRSVMGYDGTSVAVGDLIFTESITGDVDLWRVTNVVAAGAVHVRLDVQYQPAGETNGTEAMPTGPAALCTVSTNAAIGYPQRPSATGALVSDHLLNEVRNYSFRLIPDVGSASDYGLGLVVTQQMARAGMIETNYPGGATISTGSTASVTRDGTNLVFVVPSGGGGSGDASAWYTYPAADMVNWDTSHFISGVQTGGSVANTNYAPSGQAWMQDWTDTANALVVDGAYATGTYDADEGTKLLRVYEFPVLDISGPEAVVTQVIVRLVAQASEGAANPPYVSVWTNAPATASGTAGEVALAAALGSAGFETHDVTIPVAAFTLDSDGGFSLGVESKQQTGGESLYVDALLLLNAQGYVTVGTNAYQWEIGPRNLNGVSDDWVVRRGEVPLFSVSTTGVATATGDVVGNGVSLGSAYTAATGAQAWAQAGSNLAAGVRADYDFLSNAVPQGATIAGGAADGVTRSGTNLVITWNTNLANISARTWTNLTYVESPKNNTWSFDTNDFIIHTGTFTPLDISAFIATNPHVVMIRGELLARSGSVAAPAHNQARIVGSSTNETILNRLVAVPSLSNLYVSSIGDINVTNATIYYYSNLDSGVRDMRFKIRGYWVADDVTSGGYGNGDFLKDGSVAMTGNLDAGGNAATNISQVRGGTGTFDRVNTAAIGWQLRVGTARAITQSVDQVIGYDTIVKSNRVTFTAATYRATPIVPGVYYVSANILLGGIPTASFSYIQLRLRKNGSDFVNNVVYVNNVYFVNSYSIGGFEYFDGDDYCDVAVFSSIGALATNRVSTNLYFSGFYIGQ